MSTTVSYRDVEKEQLAELINAKETFELVGASGHMSDAVEMVERAIESQGLSCRV